MALVIDGFTDQVLIYRKLLYSLLDHGEKLSPRGLPTRMIRTVVIEHDDPGDVLLIGTGRGLSKGLLAAEPLQLVGGFSDPAVTISIVPHYANFMDDGRFWGAYGLRIRDKTALVAERLLQDPYTRQARMNIWEDGLDLAFEGKHDYPCTTGYEFYIDSVERLNLIAYMRSNDAWLGFPYDVVQHSCLLKSMARFLGREVGTYTHVCNNMHLYEKDIEAAEKWLDTSHLHYDRPRLDGGISKTFDGDVTWSSVQDRARGLFYSPHDIEPETLEEAFYQEAMIRESEKING